ncbi:hypothetical protein [Nibricoccus sp. IMCC34717]|uniref:hypothetical protein n=1 Tax=Nibricoccus sp. IMCC34717 TaxID=3034021 RepID=UPI00384F8083
MASPLLLLRKLARTLATLRGALFLCASLVALSLVAEGLCRMFAIRPDKLAVEVTGSFQRNGQHWEAIEPAGMPRPRLWGSWSGGDENTGTIQLGPFLAGERLRFFTCGYPATPGIRVFLVRLQDGAELPLQLETGGQQWLLQDIALPPGWRDTRVSLRAEDKATGFQGWVGVSEPLPFFVGTDIAWYLLTLFVAFLAVGPLYLAALNQLRIRKWIDPHWQLIAAAAAVALVGYLAFWVVFFHPLSGRAFVMSTWLISVWACWRQRRDWLVLQPLVTPLLHLLWLVAALMLAVLCWYCRGATYEVLTQHRFIPALPSDNHLPGAFARMLLEGGHTVHLGTDWLTSDRPPLQTAFLLLVLPWTDLLGLSSDMADGVAGFLFQLLWVPACLGLLTEFGFSSRRARLLVVAMAATGFVLLNTTFVWPKMAAAAFGLSVFGMWILNDRRQERGTLLWGALFLVLAWLCHGGVAFSLLALVPWAFFRLRRVRLSHLMQAVMIIAIVWAPWVAFQKLHAPPGNRLLKWHLAGQIDIDSRPFGQTLLESYRARSLSDHLGHRRLNFETQLGQSWDTLFKSNLPPKAKRHPEFFFTTRALGLWLLGVPLLVWSVWRGPLVRARSPLGHFAAWVLTTIALWCLLIFQGGAAVIHQGSYAATLGLFLLCGCGFASLPLRMATGAFALLTAYFAWVWWQPALGETIPANPLAILTFALGLACLGAFLAAPELTPTNCSQRSGKDS